MSASLFDSLRAGRLLWQPENGYGYYEVEPGEPYDAAYFDKYQRMADTPMGRSITAERVACVRRWWDGRLVDVGIGCGQFCEAIDCAGFDINPAGVDWLRARGRFVNPYSGPVDAATFWDSLEHIRDPRSLLANVRRWAFVSLPIFESAEHAMTSRHFRRDEHYHYWTERGFVRFMTFLGFCLRETSDFETRLGRDGIQTFAFERTA